MNPLPADIVRDLRRGHYNATLTAIFEPHGDLRILRVVPDVGVPPFRPGQFLSLGLGNWEPRVAGVDEEHVDELHLRRLARRAYSISCSIVDERGQVARADTFPYLEFYVALVRHADKHPPALTPRLFALKAGDRLFVDPHISGHYTLDGVGVEHDVFFFATGTGEAPHNAMIAELLAGGQRGRIVSAVSVRYRRDAAYRAVHEQLAQRYSNYHYLVVTTREPENLDATRPDYVGKRYLQALVASGELERQTGANLDPARAHVFLCGSPDMIGLTRGAAHEPQFVPGSMLALLSERGFNPDAPHTAGNVHFERYW
ncbi:MAG TPA: ferredoxin--NADP reductase [Pirellulaceae bacterium]|nr:ferredoxin--NADP reductase [Pirellulaceae bacterium]